MKLFVSAVLKIDDHIDDLLHSLLVPLRLIIDDLHEAGAQRGQLLIEVLLVD